MDDIQVAPHEHQDCFTLNKCSKPSEDVLSKQPKKRIRIQTEKRKEQNRSNQRAFRQRRESYVKDLEVEHQNIIQLADHQRAEIEVLKAKLADDEPTCSTNAHQIAVELSNTSHGDSNNNNGHNAAQHFPRTNALHIQAPDQQTGDDCAVGHLERLWVAKSRGHSDKDAQVPSFSMNAITPSNNRLSLSCSTLPMYPGTELYAGEINSTPQQPSLARSQLQDSAPTSCWADGMSGSTSATPCIVSLGPTASNWFCSTIFGDLDNRTSDRTNVPQVQCGTRTQSTLPTQSIRSEKPFPSDIDVSQWLMTSLQPLQMTLNLPEHKRVRKESQISDNFIDNFNTGSQLSARNSMSGYNVTPKWNNSHVGYAASGLNSMEVNVRSHQRANGMKSLPLDPLQLLGQPVTPFPLAQPTGGLAFNDYAFAA